MRKGLRRSSYCDRHSHVNVVTILPGAVLLYGLQYAASLQQGKVMVYWGNVVHPGNTAYHTEDKNNLTAASHETLQKPIKMEAFWIFHSEFKLQGEKPQRFLPSLVSTPLKRPNADCEASALELLEEYNHPLLPTANFCSATHKIHVHVIHLVSFLKTERKSALVNGE